MGKLLNSLFGLLRPDSTAKRDAPAERTPPAQIPYAHMAPELCMLPKDGPSIAEWADAHRHISPLQIDAQRNVVQFKADGIRALYIDGRIVSREGAPLDCALHCTPGLARLEAAIGLGPLFIEGEYVAEDGFEATLAEHKKGEGQGVFWIFDMMPLIDWQSGRSNIVVQERLEFLVTMVNEHCDSNFVGALNYWVLTREETLAKAREIWAEGGEGVVVKRWNSSYERKRSDAWLRLKQVHTVDAMIVDMHGRPDGTLKRMVLRADEETLMVGTGWKKDEGKRLLSQFAGGALGSASNSWAEISFQRTTGAKRSIRGARFVRLRDAKGTKA